MADASDCPTPRLRRGGRGLVIGAAVGSGISAQTAARGGVDVLLAVNAGRMRNMGAPSIASLLPCHHATALTEDFAPREVLPRTDVPILLGVNCWDAEFDVAATVDRVAALGFSGAVNFPNATLMPTGMRRLLDRGGRGTEREIALLAAVQARGLMALYYGGSRAQVRAAARAGIGMILLNFGWNAGGADGHARRASLEEVGLVARDLARDVRRIAPRTTILLEGGPVVTVEDLARVVGVADLDGYVGGSTLDRLPFAESVMNRIAGYRQAADRNRELTEGQAALARWGARHGIVGTAPPLLTCLESLRGLARGRRSVALRLEAGTPVAPYLSALTGGADWPRLDLADTEDRRRAAPRLFGREGAATEPGLLTSGQTEVVVLRNVHLAPARLQRRLATSLADGVLVTSHRRRRLRIAARCVFLFEAEATAAWSPSGLDPALADYLAGWTVTVPPLRDRVTDLPALIADRADVAGVAARDLPEMSPAALQGLRRHPWPGNEAELTRALGRLLTAARSPVSAEDVAAVLQAPDRPGAVESAPRDLERRHLVEALWRNDFHRGRTAEALHVSRKTLYNRMRRFGLTGGG